MARNLKADAQIKLRAASRRCGFTLIELTVVMLILSIIAAAVTVNLAGRTKQQRFAGVIDKIRRYEFKARRIARRFDGGLQLEYDLYDNTVSLISDAGGDSKLPSKISLGEDIEIAEFIGGTSAGNIFTLDINHYGCSDSYGLAITDGVRTSWLLVAGLTGEVSVFNSGDEQKVREILTAELGSELVIRLQ